jgi:hypothetical protein
LGLLDHGPQLGRESDQEREPGGLLEVGHLGEQRVGPRGLEPRGGVGERDREALGVGGRAQAGHERVAVAVIGGAGELPRDEPAARARRRAARARRRRRAGLARGDVSHGRLAAQVLLELARADRALVGEQNMPGIAGLHASASSG